MSAIVNLLSMAGSRICNPHFKTLRLSVLAALINCWESFLSVLSGEKQIMTKCNHKRKVAESAGAKVTLAPEMCMRFVLQMLVLLSHGYT